MPLDSPIGVIQLSPWQRKVAGLLQSVETLNTVLLAGGRGGGKSILLIWIIIFYGLLYGDKFNGVLIRADLAGLSKLESLLMDHIPVMLPGSKYLKAKRRWQLSTGGTLGLIHMDGNDGFAKIQGEDLNFVGWDEITQEPDPQVVLRVRSSMRTTDATCPPKFIATGNPLGPGTWWLRDYVVAKSLPSKIFGCEFFGGSETVWIKSTLRDNPYLANPDSYEQELVASCFGDEAKINAEVRGDWGVVEGGFFGTCLSVERSMLPGDFKIPMISNGRGEYTDESRGLHSWIGGDWGTASPACGVLMYEVPEDMECSGKWIPRGSWVAVDEEYVCGVQRDGAKEWNRGDRNLTAPQFVQRMRALYQRNQFVFRSISHKRTIMDSAVCAQLGIGSYSGPVTLASEFEKYGWKVTGSPKSSRAVGWQLMKSLLWGAGSEAPGLFITERCESLWQTLPYCVADDRKGGEDMMPEAPDHSADAVRYVLTASNQGKHQYRAMQPTGHLARLY